MTFRIHSILIGNIQKGVTRGLRDVFVIERVQKWVTRGLCDGFFLLRSLPQLGRFFFVRRKALPLALDFPGAVVSSLDDVADASSGS